MTLCLRLTLFGLSVTACLMAGSQFDYLASSDGDGNINRDTLLLFKLELIWENGKKCCSKFFEASGIERVGLVRVATVFLVGECIPTAQTFFRLNGKTDSASNLQFMPLRVHQRFKVYQSKVQIMLYIEHGTSNHKCLI